MSEPEIFLFPINYLRSGHYRSFRDSVQQVLYPARKYETIRERDVISMQRTMSKNTRVFNFWSVGKYNEPRLIRIEKNRDSQEMIKSGSLVARVKVFKRPVISGIWHIPNSFYKHLKSHRHDTSTRRLRRELPKNLKSLKNIGFPIVSGRHP